MVEAYREMLAYIKSAVTRNYSEKCINSIMDYVSGSASQNFGLLQEFYQTTLKALEEAKNEVNPVDIVVVVTYIKALPINAILCLIYMPSLCRDYGLRQIWSFVRFSSILVNMDGWVRYRCNLLSNLIWMPVWCYWSLVSTSILKFNGFVGRFQILKELHKSCQREDGTDDHKKGTQLLEVYAIEIQMYTETKNNKKLKVSIYFGK